jgi:hypothetical protein
MCGGGGGGGGGGSSTSSCAGGGTSSGAGGGTGSNVSPADDAAIARSACIERTVFFKFFFERFPFSSVFARSKMVL